MIGALGAWRTAVTQQLRKAGVDAVEAMEPEQVPRRRSPAIAVALVGAVCGSGGFQDYLGLEQDPDTGGQREVFGRSAELTLEMDIFAPRDAGAAACRETAEQAMGELLFLGAAGLPVTELTVGETEFLERDGLYRLPVRCRCKAWLTALSGGEDSGTFTDFEVRGTTN